MAYIVPTSDWTQSDEKEIEEVFREQVGMDVEFRYVETLSLTKRGKLSFLIQRIK